MSSLHGQVGGLLARRWDLPPAFNEAIRAHEAFNPDVSQLSQFVYCGNRIAHNLEPGDFAQVIQKIDLSSTALIRPELTLTVPESTPAGVGFEVSVVVDGVKFAMTTCSAGRTRRITDLAANVSKLSGIHTVGVRLEVVEG